MTGSCAVTITPELFEQLSHDAQSEVVRVLSGYLAVLYDIMPDPNEEAAFADADDIEREPWLTKLTNGQAREFLRRCSEDVRSALKAMVDGPDNSFRMSEVAHATGKSIEELRYVWMAITRRTRTVTGDPETFPIYWSGEKVFDGDEYVDEVGWLSRKTYESFRKAFSFD